MRGGFEMKRIRRIQIFSAGCEICEQTIQLIQDLACQSCEVEILDIHKPEVARQAREFSIQSLPSVVIDGQLAGCCTDRGVSIDALKTAGLGVPL